VCHAVVFFSYLDGMLYIVSDMMMFCTARGHMENVCIDENKTSMVITVVQIKFDIGEWFSLFFFSVIRLCIQCVDTVGMIHEGYPACKK